VLKLKNPIQNVEEASVLDTTVTTQGRVIKLVTGRAESGDIK